MPPLSHLPVLSSVHGCQGSEATAQIRPRRSSFDLENRCSERASSFPQRSRHSSVRLQRSKVERSGQTGKTKLIFTHGRLRCSSAAVSINHVSLTADRNGDQCDAANFSLRWTHSRVWINPAGFVSLLLSIISVEASVGPGARGPCCCPLLFMNLINNVTPREEEKIYKSTQKKSGGGGREIIFPGVLNESRLIRLAISAWFGGTFGNKSI